MAASRILVLIHYFIGFICGLSFIRSQSEFLHYSEPKYLVILLVAPVALWFFFLQFIQNKGFKNHFAKILTPWIFLIGGSLCFMIPLGEKGLLYVGLWIFTTGIVVESLRWGFFEITERYLGPSQLGVNASYQGIFYEFGIISASLLLKNFPSLSLHQIAIFSGAFLVAILVLMFYFLNPKRFEHYFIHRKYTKLFHIDSDYSRIIFLFLLIGVTQGLFRMSQDTYSQTIFKINSHSAQDIQKSISSVFLLGSIFQLSLFYFNAKVLEAKRISPVYIVMASFFVQILAFLNLLKNQTLENAILFLGVSKPHTGIYFISLNRLAAFFKFSAGLSMKSLNRLGAIVLGTALFAIIPATPVVQEYTMPLLCVLSIFILWKMRGELIPLLQKNILSPHPDECVRAAVGLTYAKPLKYVDTLSQVLEKNPSQFLRKQIILGLGHEKSKTSFEILEKEFLSDQEEIQITVLEALNFARSNKATRFILDLVLSHKKSLTLRVRLNAAKILASLYGTKSIPILMMGLRTEDPRLLANVLEALSQFRDPELIEIYKTHSRSEVPRIRANALIGLYQFKKEASWVKQEIHRILLSQDINDLGLKISIFYTIGKNKIKEFTPILKSLLIEHLKNFVSFKSMDSLSLSYLQSLSWALMRLKVSRGSQVMLDILKEHIKNAEIKSPIHFILQLDLNERMKIFEDWIFYSQDKIKTRKILIQYFQDSGYDLHEEIEYLMSMNLEEEPA